MALSETRRNFPCAAFLCSLLGLISVFYYESTLKQNVLPAGISVLLISWLYAAILAEVILRPLIFKLSHAITLQNKDDA
ncbi:hypothetical protein [Alishewanella sp. HL-SH06]|uniref:hypothetical protein n=1 Tax=Alishewanella sp. HL-SH06 TaxID=3461144 RepID=UPI00404218A4